MIMGLSRKFAGMGTGVADVSALLPKAMSLDYLRLWASLKTWVLAWLPGSAAYDYSFVTRTVSGSAQADSTSHFGSVRTGTTAGSRARLAMNNLAGGNGLGPDGEFGRTLDFTEPGLLAFRFNLVGSTTNGKAWFKFGESCNADGDLTGKGLQIRIDDRALTFGVHDGATLEEAAGAAIAAGANAHSVRVEWDGNGNWTFYFDDAAGVVVAHNAFTSGYGSFCAIESYNGADAASQWFDSSPIKFGTLA